MIPSVDPRKSTVAHLLPWSGVGGTEHATLRIAHAVKTHGFRSVVLCRSETSEVRDFVRGAGFPTYAYHAVGPSVRHPAAYVRNSRALASELVRMGADILHCADVMGAVYGAPAGRLAGIPVICHVRNQYEALSWRDRLPLRAVNRFAFVSKDTWHGFPFGVKPRDGRVIYDGIRATPLSSDARQAARQELGLPPHSPVVGMVARMSPQKDYFTLGRAAARVVRVFPDVRFVIVGDTSREPSHARHFELVQAELLRLNVLDSFVFTGFRSDVSRVLHAFDVFVLSTHFEGLPLVVLEAMGAGLPTVATAVNGIPEIIPNPTVGRLFPPGDDHQLADHLIQLLTDKDARDELGDRGRQFVADKFSPEAFTTSVVHLYREVLGA